MSNRDVMLVASFLLLLPAGGCRMDAGNSVNTEAAINQYVQARLHIDAGDLDAALAELAAAVKADPTLSVAHATAGDIYRQKGDWQGAGVSYEEACRTNPYAFKPHYHLGLTYQTLADMAKAVDQMQEYLREAVHVYLRAQTLDPKDFDAALNLSACYFRLGKFDLAEKYCKTAIEIRSDDPHAHCNLGIIYDCQDKPYDAINAYKASLELDIHQPKLLVNLGSTYMRQGRLNLALEAFKLAAEEDPQDAAPWEQLGACHYRQEDYAKATEAYVNAIARNETGAKAHRGLGVVYMTEYVLGNRQDASLRDKGLAAWHVSLEIEPTQADLQELVRKYTPTYTGPKL